MSKQSAPNSGFSHAARHTAAKTCRSFVAGIDTAQLLLQREREIEGQKKELRSVYRAAFVRRERRKVVAHRHNRDRLRHPMDGRDLGKLGRLAVFGQITNDDLELSR